MRGERVDERGEGSVGAGDGIVAGGAHGAGHAPPQDVAGSADHCGDQRLLVGEVEVETALGGVGGGGDLVHLGVRVTALGKDLRSGVEQVLAALDRAGLSWRRGRHRPLQDEKNPTRRSVSVLYQHV